MGIDERDDLSLNVVNVGELVIEPGGRVIVQGNLLAFEASAASQCNASLYSPCMS